MKKLKFTDSQIMKSLKRVQAALSTPETYRELGIALLPFTCGAPSWWHGCDHDRLVVGTGSREQLTQEDVCLGVAQSRSSPQDSYLNVVRPSRQCEMAKRAVEQQYFKQLQSV